MKEKKVKDLMVPLSAYATVNKDATLSEAVLALKQSQAQFDQSKYRHRAIMVLDEAGNIVGKLSMISILRSLEPKYDEMLSDKGPLHVGFTRAFQRKMLEQLRLWEDPLEQLCKKAAQIKVFAFMREPGEAESIEPDASLNQAIHQLVLGSHQSLLVTDGSKVIGVLRVTDVYEEVATAIAACEI